LKGTILLNHPTIDQLHALGLHGMAQGFKQTNPQGAVLDHAEWLASFSTTK